MKLLIIAFLLFERQFLKCVLPFFQPLRRFLPGLLRGTLVIDGAALFAGLTVVPSWFDTPAALLAVLVGATSLHSIRKSAFEYKRIELDSFTFDGHVPQISQWILSE
jgi:hypothetical protein